MKKELTEQIIKLSRISFIALLFISMIFKSELIFAQNEKSENIRFSEEELSNSKVTKPSKNKLKSASTMLKSASGSISVGEDNTYNSFTAEQLVKNVLVTGCLQANNVRFGYYNRNSGSWTSHNWSNTPGDRMLGYFSKGTSNFPINEGLILSTGKISSAMGPNNSGSKSDEMASYASDPDLATITNRTMYDAAILEFDFVPAGNTVEFKYVFASEEYIEYCETQYNDAFGFFLSGPGISGPYSNNAVNLATIPGNIAVSINTIHPAGKNVNNQNFPAENSQYYFDNPSGSTTMQFDGSTVELTATYTVQPCQTYRIKMAVADASDQKWDAGVFLGARSFNSETLSLENFVNNNISANIFEGCTNNKLVITRQTSDLSQPYTVDLILAGSAINGRDILTSDGQPFPTQITIPANQATFEIPFYANFDELNDNDETFIIKVRNSCPCDVNVSYIEKVLHIYENVSITSLVPQNAQCNGQNNGVITVNATGGSGLYQYSKNNGTTWQTSNTFSGLVSGTYTILVKDPGSCHDPVSKTTTVDQPTPIIANAGPDAVICSGSSIQLSGSGGIKYSWSPSTGLNNTTIANPIASPTSTTIYTLTVTNASGQCSSSDQVTVTVNPSPVISINPVEVEICKGTSTTISASGAVSYVWNPGDETTPSITVSPNSNTNYTVTGTGLNGCKGTASSLVVVNSGPRNVNAGTDANIGFCETHQFQGSATGENLSYSWSPSTNLSNSNIANPVFTPSVSGTFSYTLTVTGENGCSETDEIQILVAEQVEATITSQTNNSCFNNSAGSATVTATGGTSPYSYSWNTNPTQTGVTASNLTAGIYTVTITDNNGCSTATTVTITQPTAISAFAAKDNDVSCNAGNDGKLTVTASGGTGILQYSINGGTSYQASNVFSGLATGIYTITVKDANNCTKTTNAVTISQPTAISASAAKNNDVSCNAGNDGKLTVTASGGTGILQYSINGGTSYQASNVFSGLATGNYTITVKDANNCTKTTNAVTISQPNAISALAAKNNDVSCNTGNDGKLTVTASGGTGILQYSINGGTSYQASNVFSGLTTGNYTITVKDANNCTKTTNAVTISQPAVLSALAVQDSPADCNGHANGAATVTVTGGNVPYTYAWDKSASTTASATDLAAGVHTITVTDAKGCVTTATVTITQPDVLSASAVQDAPADCNGQANGAATVTVSGGNVPYAYAWDKSASTLASATDLAAGLHTITVTDAKGCVTTATVTITQPDVLSASAVQDSPADCNGQANGAATVTVSGGNVPYAYAWDKSASTLASATDLAAGLHTITVTDAKGCETTATVTIAEPAVLSASAVQDSPADCNGQANGAATVTVSGGNVPYAYAWDKSASTLASATDLAAGLHTITVTDAKGCVTTATVTIAEPAVLSASAVQDSPADCNGQANGAATVTVSGGNVPYTYAWDKSASALASATDLAAGLHTITVTDSKGCETTATVTIAEPAVLSASAVQDAPADCNGQANGAATVTVSGGNVPYAYAWDKSASTSASATDLAAGLHTITVTDAKGCETTATVTIAEPAVLSASAVQDAPADCNGQANGAATVTVSGGNVPYAYAWDKSASTLASATDLAAGVHTITVTDSKGCVTTATVTIAEPDVLSASAVQDAPADCNGQANGAATVTVSGGNVPYAYAWDKSASTLASATDLAAGLHTITVTDSKGCETTATVTIAEPAVLSASAVQDAPADCNGQANGAATVTVSGGNVPYAYAWDKSASTLASATDLAAGLHTITVTDSKGCVTTAAVTIAEPDVLSASAVQDAPADCNGQANGAATVTVSGGNVPYAYAWDKSASTLASAADLAAGLHTITITDAKGCETTATVTITQPDVLSASAVQDAPADCNGQANGAATVTVSGGNVPYAYAWDKSASVTASATDLAAGLHTITVTDSKGCVTTATVTIAEPAVLSASAVQDAPADCNGQANGAATVTVSGGNVPYAYAWDKSASTLASAADLAAGLHTITITDAKGCETTATVTITQPDVLSASAVQDAPADCNGQANGAATVTVSGGNVPYAYAWDKSASVTASATDLAAGVHTITVTDSKGCVTTATVTIAEPAVLSASAVQDAPADCNGQANGAATVTVSGGNVPYAYAWDKSASALASATDLAAGLHTITVTDSKGCETTATVTIAEPAVLSASAVQDAPADCNGQANGAATVTVSGGNVPYAYAWDKSASTSASATDLAAGLHTITVTDAKGCETTATVTIAEPAVLSASAVQDAPADCNGQANGAATVTVSGGNVPYAYAWDKSASTTASATDLAAGLHTITVTDSKGCVTTATVTITQPDVLSASAVQDAPADCNGQANGAATVTVSGGNVPYAYAWDKSASVTASATDLAAGLHTITVTDSKGCVTTATVTIAEPAVLSASAVQDSPADCNGQANGAATVTVSGGNVPYAYAWDKSASVTASATDLAAGLHTITVTDSKGCVTTATVTITQPDVLSASAVQDAPADCNGQANGAATVTVSGGNVPYSYAWDKSASTLASAADLAAGLHTITITDAKGCETTATVTITQPDVLSASAVQDAPADCNGQANGAATVTVSGGNVPYTYAWDKSASTAASAADLAAGLHTITVTDSKGCVTTATVTIAEPAVLSASAVQDVPADCNGQANGAATVTVSGGNVPYAYAWDKSASVTASATDLAAGLHTITVTDSKGCVTTATVTIAEPAVLSASAVQDSPADCNGQANGAATVTVSGGNVPYAYAWDKSASVTASATDLAAGLHTITVTDSKGCVTTATVTIAEPAVLSASAVQDVPADCNGQANGAATVTVSGGNVPYTYAWDKSASTTASATDLAAGLHTITVTDSKGCVTTATVTIAEPDVLSASAVQDAPADCNGQANGAATVTVSGGNVPYTYAWDKSASTTASATDLAAGLHTITVTDSKGCETTATVTISEPAVLSASAVQDAPADCNGQANGAATVTVSGGNVPYAYAWDKSASVTASATDLAAGLHTITVTDSKGCVTTATVTITQPDVLSASAVQDSPADCNGQANGAATVTVSGGNVPYSYAWDKSASTLASAADLAAGLHTITITDAKGCETTATVTITQPDVLSASAVQDSPADCNGQANGAATVTVSGGNVPYTYAWDKSASTAASAADLAAGLHTITVTDSKGCVTTATVTIAEPAVLSASAVQDVPADCNGQANGAATVTVSGGNVPYAYAWDKSASVTASATDLAAGLHTITVTDSKGCVTTATVTIAEPAVLSASAVQDSPADCNGQANGAATVTVSGGNVPYAYAWDKSASVTASATDLAAGLHTITVTDSKGCVTTATVTIAEPAVLSASAVQDAPADCNGQANGAATVTVSGGNVPYAYAWDKSASTLASATDLAAGLHTITVTDSKGCVTTAAVTIAEPDVLSASAVQDSPADCNGQANGAATVTVSGGNVPYAYAWDKSASTLASAADLAAGLHTITITDAKGCETTATVTITQPDVLSASAVQDAPADCNGQANGAATVTVSGGNVPYAYAWDKSASVTASATDLAAGLHTITVTDSKGCVTTATVTIAEPAVLSASAVQDAPADCNGQANGAATVTVSGGNVPYAYAWDKSASTLASAADLAAGLHTITITDAKGCETTATVTITQPDVLSASAVQDAPADCNGQANGAATVTVSGGNVPYAYAWDKSASVTASATDLAAGLHTITVTDSKGCVTTATVTIAEPAVLSASAVQDAPADCNGQANGAATVTVSGGNVPYAYAWDKSASALASATDLAAGLHTITVTDSKGCETTATVTIAEPAVLSASAVQDAPADCNGQANGAATVTVSGGNVPYAYAWDKSASTSASATDLAAGLHTITVTDAKGCETTATVTIAEPAVLSASAVQDAPADCNGQANGAATVTVSGGNVPYAYAWDKSASTTASATDLAAGLHTITVTDSKGCVTTATVTITQPDVLSASAVQDAPADCNGQANGAATVTVSGGNVPYAYAWDKSASTLASAADLAAGLHTITITDAKGCETTATVTITQPDVLSASAVQDSPADCNGQANGAATVTVSGGNVPYAYAWDKSASVTASATDLAAGLHTITVTDSKGCVTTATVTIAEPDVLSASAVQDAPADCNGQANGAATVTVSGGNVPYAYAWDKSASTLASAADLAAGLHTITITDAKGCETTATVTITQPDVLSASAVQDAPADCNGQANGAATVTVSGGNVPYTYAWDKSASTAASATDLAAGLHTITVTDSKGCVTTATVTIAEPAVLSASAVQDVPADCNGQANGAATVTVSGGNVPYAYAWDKSASVTASATDLAAGLHTITVTDSKGCVTTATVTIAEPAVLSASAVQDSPADCNGQANGAATVTVSGGNVPYAYAWDKSASVTASATDLAAGLHTITVTDSKGCVTTATVTIAEPAVLSASAVQDVPADCNGQANGAATVTVSGGNVPYTYAWDKSASTTASATDLAAGLHTITVTDSKGCVTTATVTIAEPDVLSASAVQDAPADCNGQANGAATVTVSGGNVPYTYAWDKSASTTASATDLAAGLHTITVTDSKGCETTATVTISEPAVLSASAVQDAPADCNGQANGAATVTVSGGNVPYAYAWDKSASTLASAADLAAGLHTITITDAKGCETTATVTITQPDVLSASAVQDAPADCNGQANGAATVTVSGGNVPYAYAWDKSASVTASATDLAAGLHTITVTDSKGCVTTATVTIAEPDVLSASAVQDAPADCNGQANGAATVTVSGGNVPYAYAWDKSASTTASATDLAAGLHTITVTDSKGCETTATVTIAEPAVLSASAVQDAPADCNGQANGAATVTVSGGNVPYAYAWDKSASTLASAADLAAGLHTITITDAKGCETTATVTITQPDVLSASAVQDAPADCNGQANGAATVTVSGGNIPYTYVWDKSASTLASATDMAAGLHTITVTDSKGCVTTAAVTISEPDVLSASAVQDAPADCNGQANGAATVTVSGGNVPYTYAWDKSASVTASATDLAAGVHTITVTDSKGCVTTATVTIAEPAVLSCNANQDSPVTISGAADGVASVVPSGGNGGYSYLWDNGETTATAVALNAGSHSVTVTDSKGCETSCNVTITEPGVLFCSVIQNTQVVCNGQANGAATVTASGGVQPYSYLWDNNETSQSAVALNAGLHSVTVTDANGATSSCNVTISQPDVLSASAVQDAPADCNGQANGAATVTVSGGNVPYAYAWDKSASTTASATDLAAGLHTIIVTDSKGCVTTATVTIAEPAVLSASAVQDAPADCNGQANGAATVTVSGGNVPYAYAWDKSASTTASATDLAAGVHTITVTDSKGCVTTATVTIAEPAVLSASAVQDVPADCNGQANGAATVTVSGGNVPYTYAWDKSASTTASATDLAAGLHTITVTDSKGCVTTATVTIAEPDVLSASAVQDAPADCNGQANGAATVTVSGGNVPYTYAWDKSASTTASATDLAAGLHTITVTDSKGCVTTATVTIAEPAVLSCNANQDSPVTISGAADGVASVVPSGGNSGYSYLWDNGETTATAVALKAGSHSVTVTDSKRCETSCNVIITEPGVLFCSVIQNTQVVCNGQANGSATVTASGGVQPYSYLWDNNETSQSAVALNAGLHSVTVTDANGATSSCNVTISQPDVLSASAVQDAPADCNGQANGAATVTVSGGNVPYAYAWDKSASTLASAADLAAGLHTITITDAKGCETTATVTITQPDVLSASAVQDAPADCNGQANGAATVTVSGGNIPYTYVWDKSASTLASATDMAAGLHTITVTDSKGCVTTAAVTISEPDVLSASAVQDAPADCNGQANGAATVTVSGGNVPYTYAWDKSASVTASATDLAAGVHTITVTDSKGCVTTATVTIAEPAVLSCNANQDSPVTISGAADGVASVVPSGGNGGYSYLWDNGETTATAVALNAGSHSVTVTDSKGCETSCNVTITEPGVLFCSVIQNTQVVCNGQANGAATVTASGGVQPYSYLWDNNETSQSAVALNAGLHSVTVTDANGATSSCNVTISQPDVLSASAVQDAPADCNGQANGAATVTVSGGNVPYAYAWDKSASTTASATDLAAGLHTIIVTDSKGCVTTATVTIAEPAVLSASAVQDAPADCNGQANGAATVTVSGGNVPYAYAWDKSASTTASATDLAAGVHTITVTDSKGCVTTATVTIAEPAVLSASAVQDVPADCNGQANGAATVTVSGGNVPYTYAWDKSASTTASATDLAAGLHTITVTDSKGCVTTATVTIAEPDVLSASAVQDAPADCNGQANGAATVTVSGGNVPYTYAWDKSASTTASATDLAAGLHTITVTDSKGCVTTATVTIAEPAVLSCNANQDSPVTISGAADGVASVVPSGGNSGYSYLWDNGETTATAVALKAGSHSVTVTDSKRCETSCNVIITEPGVLFCSVIQNTQVVCNGQANGSATVTASGGVQPYSYLWDNNETSQSAVALNAGLHSVTVTDANGATSSCNVTISQPDEIKSTEVITACDSYNWNNTEYFKSGTYIVKLSNSNGCDSVATLVLTITGSSSETINQTACNQIVINDSIYTESGIYTQKLTNSAGCDSILTINLTINKSTEGSITEIACNNSVINNITYTESGIYTQKLTNSAGCDSILTINLTIRGNIPPVITAEASDKNVECDGKGNSSELKEWLESIGGTGSAKAEYGKITWSNNFKSLSDSCGATGSTIVTFTATDDCGNTASTTAKFTIEDKTAPVIICPENVVISVNANDPDAIVNIPLPTVSDNCGNVSFINNYNNSTNASDKYPIGKTTIVYTATDECGNTSTCEFTVTVICEGQTRIDGIVYRNENKTGIANAMVILIPQNQTAGNEQLRVTNKDGEYAFTGITPGEYLVQVLDANLNAQGLYPEGSSLFFTKIEDCIFQKHDFVYENSSRPSIGDLVWYDLNGNGIQDEWFDANNDNVVTKNIPDANGAVDFEKWEWIDLNGDGKSSGQENEGELNKAGFGNALNANIRVTGPNNYNSSVIIGYTGYWRERPAENSWGEYKAELNLDENLIANAKAISSTGLVKILPASEKNAVKNSSANKTNVATNVKFDVTTKNPLYTTLSISKTSDFDLDFGIQGLEEVLEMVLVNDIDTTQMNTAVTIFVKNNDKEIPAGSDLSAPTQTTIGGTIKVNIEGSVTYTPPVDFIGTDKFDYTITTPDGRKDSATVTIVVLTPVDLFIDAQNDEFEIFNDKLAEGNIINNDINPVGDIVINTKPMDNPDNGWVVINQDGTMVYTPVAGFSGIDSFSYQICNSILPNVCDVAVVTIYVLDTDTINPPPLTPCENFDVFVPNGYSPNDDGINDNFVVSLICTDGDSYAPDFVEKYPDAKVEIFNRWGNLVYTKENFGNIDRWGNIAAWWDGTSSNGMTVGNDKLPAGTYFYILYFNDGKKEPKAGSVFLNR